MSAAAVAAPSALLSRRRALAGLAGLAGLGVASVAVAGRAGAQEAGPGGPVTTAQDAAGPVVAASAMGSASAPADRVLIQLVARSSDDYGKAYEDTSASGDPAATPVPGPDAGTLQAAVDVLTEAGVAEDAIVVAPAEGAAGSFFGPGSGMVGAELSGETLGLLPGIVADVSAALTEQGLLVDQPLAAFLADGCQDLRAEALRAAVEAARADADALAAALGVEVTSLHRATELGYSFTPYAYVAGAGDGCDALPELADLPRTYLGPYDPTAPLELLVTATVELVMNVSTPEA